MNLEAPVAANSCGTFFELRYFCTAAFTGVPMIWKDDAGLKRYFDFMAKYYPDGDKDSNFNTYGYSTAQLLVHVLKQCGDDLTRENVMKQATSLKNVDLDMALPGIRINTSPTDYRVNKQLQMEKFNGERWELFGPIIEDAGVSG